jgi:hypothetical protein
MKMLTGAQRTSLFMFVLLLLTLHASSQGVVQFQNTSSTPLTTNDFQGHVGLTSGVNAYRIGLYIAPQGTTDPNAFTLMGPTTVNLSGQGAGRFNGDPLPGSFVISNNTGQTIAFQVRAWSFFAGNSYEEAALYAGPEIVFVGRSAIGETTPTTPLGGTPALFGSGFGQVGGFTLTPIIPEPSTLALAVVGTGALWFATRARRRKSYPPPSRTSE